MSYSELVFSGGSLGGPPNTTLGGPPAPQNCPQQQQQHRGGTEYALIMPQTSKQHQNASNNLGHQQPNKQATILPRPRRPEEVAFSLVCQIVLLKSQYQLAGGSITIINQLVPNRKEVHSTIYREYQLVSQWMNAKVMKEMPGSCSSTRRMLTSTDEMSSPCSSRHPDKTSRHPDEMSGPCSSLSQDTHPTMDSTIGSHTFDSSGNQFFTLPTSSRSSSLFLSS